MTRTRRTRRRRGGAEARGAQRLQARVGGLVVKCNSAHSSRVEGARRRRRLLKDKGCEHYLDMALRFGGDADEGGGDEEEERRRGGDAQEGEDDAVEGEGCKRTKVGEYATLRRAVL